ncbi:MAG TPA: glycosyltransferase family 4 protein [Cyclobacteriaceae bacterium]|nr:glycosyltransferase family 4 protein [Cyclobacteriaceae bacterium]
MKVLILHQYFNTPASGGALRSYYLATALAQKGIDTKVITTHNRPDRKTEIIDGVEVHYLPIPYDNRFGFFKRISSFLKFVWSIVREAGQFRDADICYAISTPLTIGLAAIWIKRRYRIPYFFEVGDLWPEAPVQLGIIKNPILKSILYKLERSIYKRAEAIVALSEAIRTEILKKVHGKDVHIIPNMADTDFYKPELKRAELEAKFSVQNKLVVSYIGTMGLANGLEYLLACAETSEALPIQFLLCGEGAMLEKLKRIASEKKLSNVTFIPAQNRDGVRDVLNVTDAVFISYQPLPVLETGSPNKYFDGLAAGKLMIVNVKGWMKKEVEQNGCGIYVDAERAEDFVAKTSPFELDKNLLKTFQDRSRQLSLKYSRIVLSDAFQKLFFVPDTVGK